MIRYDILMKQMVSFQRNSLSEMTPDEVQSIDMIVDMIHDLAELELTKYTTTKEGA